MSALPDIFAAYESGDYAGALELSKGQLSNGRDGVVPLVMCGLSLAAMGKPEEACGYFDRVVKIDPDDPGNWLNLGNALRESGQLDASIGALETALSKGAAGPEINYDIGLAYFQTGRLSEAAEYLERALAGMPGVAAVRVHLLRAYCELGRKDDAISILDGMDIDRIEGQDIQNQLGIALNHLGRIEAAERVLRKCLVADPHLHEARLTLASMYERQNRLAEARLELEKIPESHQSPALALFRAKLAFREKHYQHALDCYDDVEACLAGDNRALIDLHFDRGKVHDVLGNHDKAMFDFNAAHKASLALFRSHFPNAVVQDPDQDWDSGVNYLDKVAKVVRNEDGLPEDPVFIVGFPRSGTTLLEQLLDSHPALQSMDEQLAIETTIDEMRYLGYRYPEDLHRLDSATVSALRRKYWSEIDKIIPLRPHARLVDKYPFNAVRLPFINALFPNAKVVMLLRHPADACLSCYMQKFRLNAGTMYWSTLESTVELYAKVMSTWLGHKAVSGLKVHTLRYEDLVSDMPGQVEKLLAYIGLEWVPEIMGYAQRASQRGRISTPSYAQVTEPINRKAVGRWQGYAKHLAPHMHVLDPYIEEFGYRQ